jgi:hypothetical protein
MSAVPEPAVLPPGAVQIYDHFLPALADGTYEVRVTQTVSAPGAEPLERTDTFAVRGVRWVLDPAEVHARYPAPQASGQFARLLPNLVLTQRALPWERRLRGTPDGSPWMALLVLDPGELLGEPGDAGLYARTGTVAQLLENGPAVRAPDVGATIPEGESGGPCRWIEVSAAAFRAATPRLDELRWLAHCRQVSTADKPALALRDEGWFSVVVAGRLPAAPGPGAQAATSIVHLVSLEGVEELLVEGAAFPRAPDGSEKAVRMASLHSWSFQTVDEPGSSFHALGAALARPGEADPGALMLRRAVPTPPPDDARPAARAAEARLREGYAALDYQARTGDRAFAWYRGPLAPVVPTRLERDAPFACASAATVWDATTGTFDHSLSAAWELGRALALADGDFALRMLSLHRRAHALADALLARAQSSLGPAPAAGVPGLPPAGAGVARLLAAVGSGTGGATAPVVAAGPPDTADRPGPAQALRLLLAREDVHQAIRADAGPALEAVARWLGRLCLLEGVPFPHLVPDPAVLPPESLRFFYLDRNWIEAAVDGALSVGAHTGRDRMVSDALYADVRDAAFRAATAVRAAANGAPLAADSTPAAVPSGAGAPGLPPSCAGLLLRSALVSGWPGLSVRGLAGGEPLPVLRMERLSGSVLLCLWAGVPDRVELAEPHEGLRFGLDDDGKVRLRSVTPPVGKPLGGSLDVRGTPGMLRAGGRTLDLRPATRTGLLGALTAALGRTASAAPPLSPSELAVQMLHAPGCLSFPLPPR